MSDDQDPAKAFQIQLIRSLRALIAVQDPTNLPFSLQPTSKQMDIMNEVAKMIVDLCGAEVQRQVGVTLTAVAAMDDRVRQWMEYRRANEAIEKFRMQNRFSPGATNNSPWNNWGMYQTRSDNSYNPYNI